MKKEYPRRPPTNENLYDYFMTRVRQNLHVVLCFSPVGKYILYIDPQCWAGTLSHENIFNCRRAYLTFCTDYFLKAERTFFLPREQLSGKMSAKKENDNPDKYFLVL